MRFFKILLPALTILLICTSAFAEDGYELWQRYRSITDPAQKSRVSELFGEVALPASGATYHIIRNEIALATKGMLGNDPKFLSEYSNNATLAIGTIKDMTLLQSGMIADQLSSLGPEGFYIGFFGKNQKQVVIVANEPVGALYGTFHLLRILQSGKDIKNELPVTESPKVTHRLLNHWDNIDRTVERGYAGFSIWDWHKLPDYIDTRYIDYARANASIGINGTVLTNVNANAIVLTPQYIEKVKALADLFRLYGIRVYLTARFSAPIELDKMKTADPLDEEVQKWWKNKANEIYAEIPDFG